MLLEEYPVLLTTEKITRRIDNQCKRSTLIGIIYVIIWFPFTSQKRAFRCIAWAVGPINLRFFVLISRSNLLFLKSPIPETVKWLVRFRNEKERSQTTENPRSINPWNNLTRSPPVDNEKLIFLQRRKAKEKTKGSETNAANQFRRSWSSPHKAQVRVT
jgi:hypothetical protein